MIFGTDFLFESEKERNIYTKFFAGYFFNEFIEGYEERICLFNEYVRQISHRTDIEILNPYTSFDNHGYLCHEEIKDEFADILISDPKNEVFICIEAKFLSHWNYESDVKSNIQNINSIFNSQKRSKINNAKYEFFLLVSKTKYELAKKMKNHKNSNFSKATKDNFDNFLFWEDLVNMCTHNQVRTYMSNRLSLCSPGTRKSRKSDYFAF